MMVVITTWLPRLACSQPGMNAQKPPNRAAPRIAAGTTRIQRQPAEIEADQRDAEAAEIGLALAADVEQAAVERDGDREPGEDEARGVEQRVADRLLVAEGAEHQQAERLQRVLAEHDDDQPGDQEGRAEVQERQEAQIDPARQLTRAPPSEMRLPWSSPPALTSHRRVTCIVRDRLAATIIRKLDVTPTSSVRTVGSSLEAQPTSLTIRISSGTQVAGRRCRSSRARTSPAFGIVSRASNASRATNCG